MFGKGKRLPVFSLITMTESDMIKPPKSKKNSKKLKKMVSFYLIFGIKINKFIVSLSLKLKGSLISQECRYKISLNIFPIIEYNNFSVKEE